jgi:hypothetical protein
VAIVAGKVQHRIAEHHISTSIWKGHPLDQSYLEVLRGQTGLKRRRKFADVLDPFGILIKSHDFTPGAQQMHEVTPIPASGIKNTHSWRNVSAQDLVEDIDVNLPELVLDIERHFATILVARSAP